jgi:hypothetical protein
MQTTLIDNKEAATTKQFAAMQASMRNIANKSKYTQAVQVKMESMRMVLDTVYNAKKVHIAFGKQGISVKVEGATVRDKHNLALLEGDWAQLGFKKRVSEQGVIYRISKASIA